MLRISLIAYSSLLAVPNLQAASVIPGNVSDRAIGLDTNGSPVLGFAGDAGLALADNNADFGKDDLAGVLVFELPDLSGLSISTANLDITASWPQFAISGSVDLYGIRSSSSNAVVLGDYGFGTTGNSGDTLLQSDFLVKGPGAQASARFGTDGAGDTAIAGWLTGLYGTGAVAGDFAFLRLQANTESNNAWNISSADNGTAADRPVLTVQTVPETGTAILLGAGALVVVGRRRRCAAVED